MAEIFCLGSSSAGNSYIFRFYDESKNYSEQIMVEAGFPYSELTKRAIKNGASISDCQACLITHCHGDHAIGANAVNQHGIRVFASRPTLESKMVKILPDGRNELSDWEPKQILPGIKVLPFLVDHDAPDPLGFVIRCLVTGEQILFINDCRTVKRSLSGIPIDYCFIECNYSDQPVHIEYNNAIKDKDHRTASQYRRIMEVHMGLHGTRTLLGTMDLNRCRGVYLMHLSDHNARQDEMRTKIYQDLLKKYPTKRIHVHICGKQGGIY